MPVDWFLPLLVLLSIAGFLVALSLSSKWRIKRVLLFLGLYQTVLAVVFWVIYFLPGVVLLRQAEAGDAFAQYRLSCYYRSRLGYRWTNDSEARRWMLEAAENGQPDAMVEVGSAYSIEDNWLGLDADVNLAKHWITRAVDAGASHAAWTLSDLEVRDRVAPSYDRTEQESNMGRNAVTE